MLTAKVWRHIISLVQPTKESQVQTQTNSQPEKPEDGKPELLKVRSISRDMKPGTLAMTRGGDTVMIAERRVSKNGKAGPLARVQNRYGEIYSVFTKGRCGNAWFKRGGLRHLDIVMTFPKNRYPDLYPPDGAILPPDELKVALRDFFAAEPMDQGKSIADQFERQSLWQAYVAILWVHQKDNRFKPAKRPGGTTFQPVESKEPPKRKYQKRPKKADPMVEQAMGDIEKEVEEGAKPKLTVTTTVVADWKNMPINERVLVSVKPSEARGFAHLCINARVKDNWPSGPNVSLVSASDLDDIIAALQEIKAAL